jgi:hypothetical protein
MGEKQTRIRWLMIKGERHGNSICAQDSSRVTRICNNHPPVVGDEGRYSSASGSLSSIAGVYYSMTNQILSPSFYGLFQSV